MTKSFPRILIGASLVALIVAGAARGQGAAPEAPGIAGTIKDKSGKPLAGITVSARSTDRVTTTSVYTDAHGVYVFPALDAGRYRIWAQGVGFTTQRSEVTLDGAHSATGNLTLLPLADFGQQLTGYEWFNSLPDDTAEHRRMKQVMFVACAGCHSLDLALQNRFNETGWTAIVKSMENAFYNGYRPGDLQPAEMRWQGQIIRHHRAELAKYLTEVRGPDSKPLKLQPLPRPTGDEARAVMTEYELPLKEKDNEPSWYSGTDWMLGPSTGMHGMVGIHDVIADPSGMAWITQARTTFETNRSLVKLDPKTGGMTAYRVTDPKGELLFFEQVATPDSAGNIWMHDGQNLVKLDTKADSFTDYRLPRVMGSMVNSTAVDSKGRAFVNGRFGALLLDPSELHRTDVAYPGWHLFQQVTPGDGTTYGIAVDSKDDVWWSESYVDKVATRDMKTGKVVEIDMRDPDYEARKALATPADLAFYDSIGGGTWSANSASPLPFANMPRRMAADKNGNKVWVPNWAQSNIAEIDINTHQVTYHRLPIRVHPYQIAVDKDHNVWTDTSLADAIWKFTSSTGQWTMYRYPSHGCGSRHMSFDSLKNEAWVPCDQANKVIRFQFRSAAELQAQQLAAGLAKASQ